MLQTYRPGCLASPYHADVNLRCVTMVWPDTDTHMTDNHLALKVFHRFIHGQACTTAHMQICTSLHLEDLLADIARYPLLDAVNVQCETSVLDRIQGCSMASSVDPDAGNVKKSRVINVTHLVRTALTTAMTAQANCTRGFWHRSQQPALQSSRCV